MENGASGPCVFSLMAPMQTASASSVVRTTSASTAPATCPGSWTVTKAAPDAFQNLSPGLTACGEKPLSPSGVKRGPGAHAPHREGLQSDRPAHSQLRHSHHAAVCELLGFSELALLLCKTGMTQLWFQWA